MAHFCGLMGNASAGRISLQRAWETLTEKLWEEAVADTLHVLADPLLERHVLQALRSLASGTWSEPLQQDDIRAPKVRSFLLRLCDEPGAASVPPASGRVKLLAPYSVILLRCLREDGEVLLKYGTSVLEFGPQLQQRLKFFSEPIYVDDFSKPERQIASAAVLTALARNGFGVSDAGVTRPASTEAEVFAVPAFKRLLEARTNSGEAAKVHEGRYSGWLGYTVLKLARNITAYELYSSPVINRAGLTPYVLDQAAGAGIDALVRTELYEVDEHSLPTKKKRNRR